MRKWDVEFMGWGEEKGDQKQTPHLQGFMVVPNAIQLTAVKKRYHATAHWEAMKGDIEENITYCSKQGNYQEIGVKPIPRKKRKNDEMKAVVETMKKEKNFHNVVVAHPEVAIKHYGNMLKVHSHLQRPDYTYQKPEVFVLWGPTETGKSRMAFAAAAHMGATAWKKDAAMGKWWDGYCGEEYIILDDFRGSSMPLSQLLVLLDGYGSYVEVKNGQVWVKPKYWCITSNKHPTEWYNPEIDISPLLRRFSDIKLVK